MQNDTRTQALHQDMWRRRRHAPQIETFMGLHVLKPSAAAPSPPSSSPPSPPSSSPSLGTTQPPTKEDLGAFALDLSTSLNRCDDGGCDGDDGKRKELDTYTSPVSVISGPLGPLSPATGHEPVLSTPADQQQRWLAEQHKLERMMKAAAAV